MDLETLAEVYGMPADEQVDDVVWLERVGTLGHVALMKDSSIATNPAEKLVVQTFNVRCFSLVDKGVPYFRMAAWFLNSWEAMATLCGAPGPFIYDVGESSLTQIL